jgi:ribitol 2-dehydrogenase
MSNRLSSKVVIITGASSGIGAATARLLALQGCRLVLAARSTGKLEALAAELAPLGVESLPVTCDVTQPADVERLIAATLERFGQIDVLFANAGLYVPGDFAASDVAAWTEMLRVNIDGVLLCARTVLPQMQRQRSGDILVTSSISGHVDIHWEPIYSATKHAVQTFVAAVRRQVAPGKVANELWGFFDASAIAQEVAARASITSEDVAHAALYMLAQPAHVTVRDLVILPAGQDI